MGRSNRTSLVSSPILVGAVTVLVTVIAIFLSYNANEGLPFVPTYDIKALVPNAAELAKDNEVRIGGKRVGLLKTVTAQPGPRRPLAVLKMSLDKNLKLRSDSTVTMMSIQDPEMVGNRYGQTAESVMDAVADSIVTWPSTAGLPFAAGV